ncbi:MAG: hypothetical protein ACJASQ_004189 [Crocinitomicaceae bacterium]
MVEVLGFVLTAKEKALLLKTSVNAGTQKGTMKCIVLGARSSLTLNQ